MGIASLKNRFSRPRPGNADPARAYGSEEQLMAEFRRQEYVQPAAQTPRAPGIRERLANLSARSYDTDAPVYSSETYSQESAPDLGWEAAFDPDAVRAPAEAPAEPAPTAEERFEQFRSAVYASPVRSVPYGSGYRTAPVYEEISFRNTPRGNTLAKPVYEEISFGPRPRSESAPVEPPLYEDLTPGAPAASPEAFAPTPPPPADGAQQNAPGAVGPVPARRPVVRGASDFQYAFWSGTILAGVALTLFSFIYACVM